MTLYENDICNETFLREQIKDVQRKIDTAASQFNDAADSDLIDSAIYNRMSLISYRSYLIKQLKKVKAGENLAVGAL